MEKGVATYLSKIEFQSLKNALCQIELVLEKKIRIGKHRRTDGRLTTGDQKSPFKILAQVSEKRKNEYH